MRLKHLNVIILIIILFSACTSYKDVPYFQDLKRDAVVTQKITNFSPLTIQPGDLLGIHVNSLNHEADQVFNYNLERPSGLNTATTPGSSANLAIPAESVVFGNLVDQEGNIHLPMLGSIKVAGLNTSEITTALQNSLSQYLSNPVVNVRILNFKISVLGDVKDPGTFNITNERITLTEAMALSGDLNTTGIRNNVLLIREINGNRQYVTLDLTSKKIFESPYFYLKNNDVIYVQPNLERVRSSDTGYQKIALVISALSVIALLITKL